MQHLTGKNDFLTLAIHIRSCFILEAKSIFLDNATIDTVFM